jgi:phosphoribosylamine--glycine ligase
MKVLVIGSGGREHALVWKISKSAKSPEIFCIPGNAGIATLAECHPLKVTNIKGIARFASEKGIDLTVVGPELQLTLGIVDEFERLGLKICGPRKEAAEIEGSKVFAKELMKKYAIPTAEYEVFTSPEAALDYIKKRGTPLVIKAEGLAAGKGVIIVHSIDEAHAALFSIMVEKVFGTAGERVVVEEYVQGEEASFLAFTDGKAIIPLPSSQDHKAIFDGDKGPNTGGMGAYSPAPIVTEKLEKRIMEDIISPTLHGMEREGRSYRGILYAGLMIEGGSAKVLEFNARMGDPETQPILMRLETDIVSILEAIVEGRLHTVKTTWDKRPSVCIVMSTKGYPGEYPKGMEIQGLNEVKSMEDIMVFHAGTTVKNGKIVTDGGRVLGVTALGETIKEAIDRAYQAVEIISWEGAYYRKDIGKKALVREYA